MAGLGWSSSLTSSALLAGRGAIAALLPEVAGVGSLTPIARVAARRTDEHPEVAAVIDEAARSKKS